MTTDKSSDWRPMQEADLPAVRAVADRVHVDYPEDPAVFAERLRLWPAGCWVLERDGAIVAYVLSHPWRARKPPSLNAVLGALPTEASTYYIHDLALLPEARGSGAGSAIVALLVAAARAAGAPDLSLVAVNDSIGFWRRHGFVPLDDPALAEKLRTYDDAARFMVRTIGRGVLRQ